MAKALDLDAIREKWLNVCPSCDAGLPSQCTHPDEDYRPTMLALIDEAERLRALVGDETFDQERWQTCSRAEAIRQANDFHASMSYWREEHDRRRFERDEVQAEARRLRAKLLEFASAMVESADG
jgi:hypothetical protein